MQSYIERKFEEENLINDIVESNSIYMEILGEKHETYNLLEGIIELVLMLSETSESDQKIDYKNDIINVLSDFIISIYKFDHTNIVYKMDIEITSLKHVIYKLLKLHKHYTKMFRIKYSNKYKLYDKEYNNINLYPIIDEIINKYYISLDELIKCIKEKILII